MHVRANLQGHTHKPKKEEEQQQQQQGFKLLREECSVGMMPGHFVLLSRQWGAAVKQLQRQRNKRKADQAFLELPLTGELPPPCSYPHSLSPYPVCF